MKQISKKYLKDTSIRMVFFNNFKTGSLIKHKETLTSGMCSMVVYKFVCPKCNSEYVGSSTKLLTTRVFEHRGISSRTLLPLGRPPQSSIRDHCHGPCGTDFSVSDFRILSRARFESELRLLETFYIEELKPSLNIDISSFNKKLF